MKLAQDFGIAVEHAALADLQLQQAGFDPGFREGLADDPDEIGANQLTQRHVDAHANRRQVPD